MIHKYISLFSSCIVFLVCLCSFVKRIIEFLKIQSDDIDIKATVVSIVPLAAGRVQPVLQYNIDGVIKLYIYHSHCSPEKYLIGDELTLKLSKKTGLVYDKEDFIKELLLLLVTTIILMCAVLFFAYDIMI